MSLVHVYPVTTRHGKRAQSSHYTGKRGADCWCEPTIRDEGTDGAGRPARVFVHAQKQDWRRKPHRRRKGAP